MKLAVLAAALALVGCSQRKEPQPREKPASAGSAVAPPPVVKAKQPPPYTPASEVPEAIRAAIAAPDRTVDDRMLDAGRKPGELLAFARVAPGQRVGELFAGGGYTSELLARVVGRGGTVFAQNTKAILDAFARGPWTTRAKRAAMRGVIGVERATEQPFPPEAKDLDLVISVLNYHDFVGQKVDRAALNASVLAALRIGGAYVIVDHSAAKTSGTRDVDTLHRIDEDVVKKEVLEAGFDLDGESDVLRNPDDPRDWNTTPTSASAKRGTSDRFVLRFVKPAPPADAGAK